MNVKKTTLAGHPLHPQLIPFPAGLLPFSFVMDVMHRATGERSYADAAYYTMAGGLVGGLAAGAAGAADYAKLPPGGELKRLGNVHAMMNIGIMALYAANLAKRRRNRSPGLLPTLVNGLCAAGLIVSQWYGGHLVYEHGVRVRGLDPIGRAPEAKLPGDHRLAEALEAVEQRAPSEGPTL